jgi:diphthine-ammonia ligase
VSSSELLRLFLLASLAQNDADLSKVTFITLLISSMDLFPAVNAVYKTYFGSSPPARACVAASLPRGRRLTLEAIAYVGSRSKDRHALHVQGLSYWAPANIGPYSQAVIVSFFLSIS